MKIPPIAQWVGRATEKMESQAELARLLTDRLRRNIDRAAVSKMTKGERDVAADEMLAIEELTGLPVPSPNVPIKIPLLDWVSAGSLVEPKSQIPESDAPLLAVAGLGPGRYFALKVQGSSMDRLSPEGSVIIVNRAETEPISGKCYIFSIRGETTFKRWHADPPYLEPYSWDPVHKPIFVKRKRDLATVGRVVRSMIDF